MDGNILKKAVITEKSTKLMENSNKYVFIVSNDATKGQIKETVEDLYGVKVVSVNVLKNRGKLKRSWVGKRKEYRTKDTKKALIQIEDGKTLKIFEGS